MYLAISSILLSVIRNAGYQLCLTKLESARCTDIAGCNESTDQQTETRTGTSGIDAYDAPRVMQIQTRRFLLFMH